MTELDRLIERARSASVDRGEAARYVRELDRWAPAASARSPGWAPWLTAGLAAAAAVLAVMWWRGSPAVAARTPVQVGDHVAILAAPGTAYRVVRSDGAGTEIAVEHGAVTARLWRTAQPYRLVLSGGGVTAAAVGTIYSLAVGVDGPVVGVVEGTVEVRAADGLHLVHAGSIWPAAGHAADLADARVLQALAAPALAPGIQDAVAADAGIDDATHGATDDAARDAASAEGASDATPDAAAAAPQPAPAIAATVKDRWRTARLLRGQGRFPAAVIECLAIADAHDPTWSPIALVEAARIELGPLAEPERAIALADRAIRDWPADALVSEARDLRCRALRQIGRGDECATAPRP